MGSLVESGREGSLLHYGGKDTLDEEELFYVAGGDLQLVRLRQSD